MYDLLAVAQFIHNGSGTYTHRPMYIVCERDAHTVKAKDAAPMSLLDVVPIMGTFTMTAHSSLLRY